MMNEFHKILTGIDQEEIPETSSFMKNFRKALKSGFQFSIVFTAILLVMKIYHDNHPNHPIAKPQTNLGVLNINPPNHLPAMQDTDIMPWGRYKGKQMQDVPASYLLWLLDNHKCSGQVEKYIIENKEVLEYQAHNKQPGQ